MAFIPLGAAGGGQRFVPVGTGGLGGGGGTSTPSSGGGGPNPGTLLSTIGTGSKLAGLGNSLFGGDSGLSGVFAGLGNLVQGAQGGLNIVQGNPAAGGLQLSGALGGALKTAGRFLPVDQGTSSLLGTAGAGLGALGGLAGGGLSLSRGDVKGVSSLLSGAGALANLAPVTATLGGVPLSAAGGAAAGALDTAGAFAGEAAAAAGADMAGVATGASLGAGLGAIGGIAGLGALLGGLLPLAFPSTPPWADYGNKSNWASATIVAPQAIQSVNNALQSAGSFQDAVGKIAVSPTPHGEYQVGIGNAYTGLNDGTTHPEWTQMVQALQNPNTVKDNPDAVAAFIKNIWVQTGAGGSATFNPEQTRAVQENLLSKLPYTAYWNGVRQQILNSSPADPRTSAWQQNLSAVPELSSDESNLYLGGLKIPTDHVYVASTGGQLSPEAVARVLQYGTASGTSDFGIWDATAQRSLTAPGTGAGEGLKNGEQAPNYRVAADYVNAQAPTTPAVTAALAARAAEARRIAEQNFWMQAGESPGAWAV